MLSPDISAEQFRAEFASLTLGSGGIGGSITGDNITVYHLFNIKRIAYETQRPPVAALRVGSTPAGPIHGPSYDEIQAVVAEVIQEILQH